MNDTIPPNVWACPYCRHELAGRVCTSCSRTFPQSEQGQIDFRPTETVLLRHVYSYNTEFGRFPWDRVLLEWPDIHNGYAPAPSADVTERLMLRSLPSGRGVALDIGCGEKKQRFREGLTALGYSPVGVDVAGSGPDALADAHLLPFADQSMDLLMCSAVWEHLKHPHHAMSEAARVAKHNARFIGSVAFAEPFHISYYHHSPLAVFELLDSFGFDVQSVILVDRYSAFYAHLHMGFAGARMPESVRRLIAEAFRWFALAPSVVKGRVDYARRAFARSHAAGVGFIAVKR